MRVSGRAGVLGLELADLVGLDDRNHVVLAHTVPYAVE